MSHLCDFDWSVTPLGPRNSWPKSLIAIHEMMLASPFAMCAGWGPDLTLIYNDDYAPILGKRHPSALGLPLQQAWPEIWDDISPLIDQVMAGQAVSVEDMHLLMTRNGYPEDTWWTFAYSPLKDDNGQIGGFLDVVMDSTAKVLSQKQVAEEQAALRDGEARFRALVEASSEAVYRMSPDWKEMRLLDGRGFLVDTEAPSIRWMERYLFEDDLPRIQAVIDHAIANKAVFELEHRVRRADGTVGWTESRAIPVLDQNGTIIEWFGMANDVTEQRRDAEHLRLVVNELNHRVKNNLAMVQAIAAQTFRRTDNVEDAIERFSARIVALGRANNLLTGEQWTEIDLAGALKQAIVAHCDDPGRLQMRGPTIYISAKSALSLTLAVHELATNSIKYGAWSVNNGMVDVKWHIETEVTRKDACLVLEWRETGGPPVSAPQTRGFGSRLIERALAAELGGTAQLEFAPEGAVCRVEMPLMARNRD